MGSNGVLWVIKGCYGFSWSAIGVVLSAKA